MKDHYNRFSVLQQNVEVQKVLQEGQLGEITPVLEDVNLLMDPLLDDNEIPKMVPKEGRPVRTTLDDQKWRKELQKRKGSTKKDSKKAKKRRVKKADSEEKEYEVKKILDKRCKNGRIEYKVKWRGYDECTWLFLTDLASALDAVNDYECQFY